jgi:hypothetical protein
MDHQVQVLRQFIRNVLRDIKAKQKVELRNELKEERALRTLIRKVLREKQDTTQHSSTGLNALEKLLSSIVPIMETGYKDLKTDEAQRKSFKAHILRAIQNLLSTASVYFSAVKRTAKAPAGAPASAPAPTALTEAEGDETAKAGPEADPQFIDIDKKTKETKPNPVDAFQEVEGEDLTGRNFALETFKKIQKQILETYSLLSNDQDREIFYDFLITNVKLYFDKFEDELKATPEEPTTPEYEAEKAKKEAEVQGATPPPAGEQPVGGAPDVTPETPAPEAEALPAPEA